MGTWSYSHGGEQSAGCQDTDGMTLSVGSCDGSSVHIVVRTELVGLEPELHQHSCPALSRHVVCDCPPMPLGSIHLPTEAIEDFIWNVMCYGGANIDEILDNIGHRLQAEDEADSAAAYEELAAYHKGRDA